MTYHTRIYVPLGRDEWEALRGMAEQEYRRPREQARALIRQALGLNKGEDTAPTLASEAVSSEPIRPTQLEGQNPTQLGERKALQL